MGNVVLNSFVVKKYIFIYIYVHLFSVAAAILNISDSKQKPQVWQFVFAKPSGSFYSTWQSVKSCGEVPMLTLYGWRWRASLGELFS